MNNLRLTTLKVSDKSQCLLCGGSSFKQRARDHNHNLKNEKKKKNSHMQNDGFSR